MIFSYFKLDDSTFYGIKFSDSKLTKIFIKDLDKINGITVAQNELTDSATKSTSIKSRILNFFKRKTLKSHTKSDQEPGGLNKFVKQINRANINAVRKLENLTIDQIFTTSRYLSKNRALTNFFSNNRQRTRKTRSKKQQQQHRYSTSSSSSSSHSPPQKDINININIKTDHYQNNLSHKLINKNKTINYFGASGSYNNKNEAKFNEDYSNNDTGSQEPISQRKSRIQEAVKVTVKSSEKDSLNMAIQGFNKKNLSSTEISLRPANDDSFLKQELTLRNNYMKLSDSESGDSDSGW